MGIFHLVFTSRLRNTYAKHKLNICPGCIPHRSSSHHAFTPCLRDIIIIFLVGIDCLSSIWLQSFPICSSIIDKLTKCRLSLICWSGHHAFTSCLRYYSIWLKSKALLIGKYPIRERYWKSCSKLTHKEKLIGTVPDPMRLIRCSKIEFVVVRWRS